VNGGTWEDLLDKGVNKLTSPLFGGFDGLDIKDAEPFRNTKLDDTPGETTNYAYNTVQRAIDTLADPELLQTNIMSIPGLTNEGLTTRLIETCESRGDALAVIDLKGTFQPTHETTDSATSRASNIDTTINNLVNRRINSSYGCAYYPWVDARDQISGVSVRLPPSVIALGVFASTEKKRDLWFAPAGFNRGGLTEGAGGVPVTGVEQRLTSGDRDKLYERNINPIASFPSEGIVVFGQKTLQVTPSALDRINVRRMLIFVKREVQSIANKILFDPNIQVTWMRFKTQTDRLLRNVQSRFGVDDFRVILDSSTTTPDLVDRNIIYAKVLIKPTRAAEFIAIDFVITRSGTDLDAL
jgi:phage tail sheath protein FI